MKDLNIKFAEQVNLANDPTTPKDKLEYICRERDYFKNSTYWALRNPNIPLHVLEQYICFNKTNQYKTLYQVYLESVAFNPSITESMFEELSNHNLFTVRLCVARNINAPAKILTKLSNEKTIDMIDAVVNNKNTPMNITNHLAIDITTNEIKNQNKYF